MKHISTILDSVLEQIQDSNFDTDLETCICCKAPNESCVCGTGAMYDELEREAPEAGGHCTTCGHPDGWCTCAACTETTVTPSDVAEYLAR